jgi:hypothetical protein
MALRDVLAAFLAANPAVEDIFYSTTPPSVALQWLAKGSCRCRQPAPLGQAACPDQPAGRAGAGDCRRTHGRLPAVHAQPGAWRCWCARAIPRASGGAGDLLRADARLFLSHPVTGEGQPCGLSPGPAGILLRRRGLRWHFWTTRRRRPIRRSSCLAQAIHHREAPQAVADGVADVAVVFYHLALRYQRIFPEAVRVRATGLWAEVRAGDTGRTACGLVGDGGSWGAALAGLFGDRQRHADLSGAWPGAHGTLGRAAPVLPRQPAVDAVAMCGNQALDGSQLARVEFSLPRFVDLRAAGKAQVLPRRSETRAARCIRWRARHHRRGRCRPACQAPAGPRSVRQSMGAMRAMLASSADPARSGAISSPRRLRTDSSTAWR